MVVLDATFLMLIFNPSAAVPGNKKGVPVSEASRRINLLISELSKSKTPILIPTPALSEVLVRAGDKLTDFLSRIENFAAFEIVPFDQMAAIEVALIARSELGKKKPDNATTYAKVKYDRQIVAIAKVRQATVIYSDDDGIEALGKRLNVKVKKLSDLPLPDQTEMFEK
jgi:hypothetical protein